MLTLGDLAAGVLGEVAPDELTDFDLVCRGFDASARAHDRAQRGVDEETAAGLAEAGEVLGGIVLAVGADLLKDSLSEGLKMSARRVLRVVRRWRATSATVLPALPPDKADGLRDQARTLAIEYGASPEDAEKIAEVMAARWPRTP